MDKFLITGGKPLMGDVKVSGAKNSVLPIIAATILSENPITISNVPDLVDVHTMLDLLKNMGSLVTISDDMSLSINNKKIDNLVADYRLVQTMRASILVLGPMLSRFGQAKVSLPGGCAIGARPVNLHISALEKMGAEIHIDKGYIYAKADKLQGTTIFFDTITVTGTQNIIMAAILANGTTVLENSAREPEVVDMANFLNNLGAKITGAGTSTITITGVNKLSGGSHKVIPDRIETGTFLIAGAITGGKVKTTNTEPEFLEALLAKLSEAGVVVNIGKDWIEVDATNISLKAVSFNTEPHPAFPTDMQSQLMVLNCIAKGTALISENIFENRFMHVPELQRMGANISVQGNTAIVEGVDKFTAAPIMATDLRASAGLVLASLTANGQSEISRIYHIDRGYEHIEEKLTKIGATIERVRCNKP